MQSKFFPLKFFLRSIFLMSLCLAKFPSLPVKCLENFLESLDLPIRPQNTNNRQRRLFYSFTTVEILDTKTVKNL